MTTHSPKEITQLLPAWSDGDESALEALTPLVNGELRRRARRCMSGGRAGHTLQTTALVNEAYLRLVDFGIAKLTPRPTPAGPSNGPNGWNGPTVRTTPGLIMGTDRYMSPEQARGREVDARADVWSPGCVLYEMLAGTPPFTGETASDVVAAVLKTQPPRLARGAGHARRVAAYRHQVP